MSSQEQRWSGHDASWLCPTPVDRARMLELDERLGSSTNVVQPLLPLAMIVAAFWVGPWTLLPLLAVPLFMAMPRLLPHLRQPEWLLLSALVALSCTLATAIGLTGGLRSPLILWPLFMVIGVATRFSRRGVLLITAVIVVTNLTAIVVAAPLRSSPNCPRS